MKKEDSVALQGLAVLMMLMLHFFMDISVYPENFFVLPEVFQRIAWTGRMCVGIFSFVSGYGMYQVLKKKDSYTSMITDCTKRLVGLYARIFMVIILCVYPLKLIFGEEILISQLPGNVFGYNVVYSGAWWFVLEYMWFMLLAPIFALIASPRVKKELRVFVALVLIGLVLFGKGIIFTNAQVVEFFEVRMQPTFLIIFAEGFLAGKMQEFLGGMECFSKMQKYIAKVRCRNVGIVLFFIALGLRYLYSIDPNRATIDILLVPVLCAGAALWFQRANSLRNIFIFFGKNSLYLWFVHSLICDRLAPLLVQKVGYWFAFYIIMLALSLVAAILLGYIEKVIKRFIRLPRVG